MDLANDHKDRWNLQRCLRHSILNDWNWIYWLYLRKKASILTIRQSASCQGAARLLDKNPNGNSSRKLVAESRRSQSLLPEIVNHELKETREHSWLEEELYQRYLWWCSSKEYIPYHILSNFRVWYLKILNWSNIKLPFHLDSKHGKWLIGSVEREFRKLLKWSNSEMK